MAERSPLHGRSIVEVLATSAGGVGTHVRSLVPAVGAAGATVRVCGAPATEELFGFRAAGAVISHRHGLAARSRRRRLHNGHSYLPILQTPFR